MKISNQGKLLYEFGICTKLKDEPFYWKKVVVPHWTGYHKLSYDKDGYEAQLNTIPMFCQVFWMWWIFWIKIYPDVSDGITKMMVRPITS